MSIKRKLAIFFSIIVSSILIANNALYYVSTRGNLIHDQNQQMEMVAQEIRIAIEHSQYGSQYVEDMIGDHLRTASIVSEHRLPADYHDVTNEQLKELRDELGISDITLFAKSGDDIVGVRSTDPKEVNVSTKDWGYWFTAMQELFARKPVTVTEGTKGENYWTGPIDVSTTDPNSLNKWGYYYDGTTNYIIDPYVRDENIQQLSKLTGPDAIVQKSIHDRHDLLEITGFNPKAFGKAPIITITSGVQLLRQANRPIIFGTYTYKDQQKDLDSVKRAVATHQVISYDTMVNGRHVIKSFISVEGDTSYVLGLVTDYSVIQNVLTRELLRNSIISLVTLIVVFIISYLLAGYVVRPVQAILAKVNEIAGGNLDARIELRSHDELGQLASNVNAMSKNLQVYTEELRSLFEQNSAAIFSLNLQGEISNLNPMAQKLVGYAVDELQGRKFLELFVEEDVKRDIRKHPPTTSNVRLDYDVRLWHKEGHEIEVGLTNVPIIIHDEIVGLYLIATDITEKKKTEEILRKSDKLAVVGRLAAGVAHEIRNPLTAIKGFVQLIRSTTDTKQEYFTIMLDELDRIEFIVNEFLVLAKPQAVSYQMRDIRVMLQNIIALVETQAIMSNVQILMCAQEPGEEMPLIECEENQLKQVFINIFKNAIEAMPEGGQIRVFLDRPDDEHVRLRFVDEGCGIPSERIPKLGEPFYTTKEKGTGLGLMISYKIINEHQGKLFIESEVGEGTTVELLLPTRLQQKVSMGGLSMLLSR